jgi:hypothetical protein
MDHDDHLPGEPATRAGRYAECNVFRTPMGTVTCAAEGQALPPAPRGFTWRRVKAAEC